MVTLEYTVDDDSGFQSYHAALLTKLAAYEIALATSQKVGFSEIKNDDRDAANLNLATTSVNKFSAQKEYLTAKINLIDAIFSLHPFTSDSPTDAYFVVLPDEHNGLSSVIIVNLFADE